MITFKRILVPIDFGGPSERASETAVALARQSGSAGSLVTLVHVWDYPSDLYAGAEFAIADVVTRMEKTAQESLDKEVAKARANLAGSGSPTEVKGLLKKGVAWREIVDAIESEKPEIVIMGTHGRRGLQHALLGSVAEKVVRMSRVPVMTIRSTTTTATTSPGESLS